MLPKPPQCEGCPAHTIGQSYVPSESPPDPKLILIGQGPGRNEAESGRPFYPGFQSGEKQVGFAGGAPGAAGRRLAHWLDLAGLTRGEVYLDNVARCWLPKNRAPTLREVAHCTRSYLLPSLRQIPSVVAGRAVVVPIGVPAMAWLYPPPTNEWRAGSLERVTIDGLTMYVIGLLHPAYIIRGQFAKEPAQVEYLKRAKQLADALATATDYGMEPTIIDTTQPPPDVVSNLTPTMDDLVAWAKGDLTQGVVVDCEYPTGEVDMVGLTRMGDLAYVCVDLIATDRGPFWEHDSREWLRSVLADAAVPKVMQNGLSADVPALEKQGYVVKGYTDGAGGFDTMLAAHVAYSEMPKRLGFLATFYERLPAWKHHVEEVDTVEEEIK